MNFAGVLLAFAIALTLLSVLTAVSNLETQKSNAAAGLGFLVGSTLIGLAVVLLQ